MSNKIKFLSKADVEKCLDMQSTIEAMKTAFSELSNKNVNSPLRTGIQLENKDNGALFMPVYFPATQLVGLKSVMIHKDNPSKNLPMIQAMYQVFDASNGKPIAIMDGEYLTAMRTGAASGLATDLLSVKDAKIAIMFGAGVQAEKQIEGICAVRNLELIYIADLNKDRIQYFINIVQPKIKAKLIILEDKKNISDADIICTATSSSNPVFDHSELKKDVHINGIGSFRPDMCEIPHETIINSKLYVDQKEACLGEAGDIVQPLQKGLITENHIYAELGEILNGQKETRNKNDGVTIFKSVGNAVQDIAATGVILQNAEKLNIGTKINL